MTAQRRRDVGVVSVMAAAGWALGMVFLAAETLAATRHAPDKPQVVFLETSGVHRLDATGCCAVTSAAKYNPHFEVVVYAKNASHLLHDADKCFRGWHNIRVQPFEFGELFQDTPLQGWYEDTMLPIMARERDPSVKHQRYCFTAMNLGNAGRAAVLWKYGGFYYDLDMISVATIEDASPRAVGIQKGELGHMDVSVNGAAMLFRDARDPYLEKLMQEFVQHFDNCKWGNNGPSRVGGTLDALGCIDRGRDSMNGRSSVCDGLTVYPMEVFYPVKASSVMQRTFFVERGNPGKWRLFQESHMNGTRAVHLWMHHWAPSIHQSRANSSSFFGRMMRDSCGNEWQDIGQRESAAP